MGSYPPDYLTSNIATSNSSEAQGGPAKNQKQNLLGHSGNRVFGGTSDSTGARAATTFKTTNQTYSKWI